MTPEPQTSRPTVSVIIIGRNEGERLIRCLRSVLAMDFPREQLEILYVDSQSTDDSVRRAEELGVRTLQLPPGPPTAARGRNAGSRLANAELLFFVDGDTIVAPQFLRRAVAYLEAHPDMAVYWGHRREIYPHNSVYNRVFDLDWLFPAGESAYCGGDAVMRKRAFDGVGGFRDDVICSEDAELCTRLRAAGHRIWHADELMTHHDIAITRFSAYWLRCYRGGHGYAEVADRSGGTLFKQESVRNHIRVAVYILTPIALIAALGRTGVAISACGAIAILLLSAWRNRWRKASVVTTLLYAVHVHFAQIPIWLGQLSYLRNRRRRIASEIIEYK